MKVRIEGKKIRYGFGCKFLLMFCIYLMMYPLNKFVTDIWGYMGEYCYEGILPARFCISTVLAGALIVYGMFLKNSFLSCTYDIFFVLFIIGELCCWTCDSNYNPIMIVILSIFMFSFLIMDRIKVSIPVVEIKYETWKVLLVLAVVLFLPFLRYVNVINLKNLLFIDVYETRAVFQNIGTPAWMGYFMGMLSRVLLPLLIITLIEKKRWKLTVLVTGMMLFLYLCGALKSIFIGLIFAFIFYMGTYREKGKRFLIFILGAEIGSLLLYKIFDVNIFLSMLRRVLIVPARLNQYYINYFTDNYTQYSHSGFAFWADGTEFSGMSISNFVGEYVIGNGTNANVGVFVEGYYSFGTIGAIFYLLVPIVIILFLKAINYDEKYYGLFFVFIYYFNCAIFSTMLLTHGLAFFLIVAYFFLREKKQSKGRYMKLR